MVLNGAIVSDHKFYALTLLLWQLLIMMINNNHYRDLLNTFFVLIMLSLILEQPCMESIIIPILIILKLFHNSLFLSCSQLFVIKYQSLFLINGGRNGG